ncbi:calmodulin-binding receptor-like cytoplasmic kinase 2 isoform X1 [Cryptomeria japonica]|uniref:calmodulin-binding receptor-like cytoplasmic kinase 2 isoform X1 n=1 Tax=Cryptomeria japonica TaxID=3369 RepID=UPI0027DA5489|nr:calmodulin-binding receptor-like cytoplasmic kinase 2 isoform X1 [Cryptomeria japonica]
MVFILRLILAAHLLIGGMSMCLNELRACQIPDFESSGCGVYIERERWVFCEALASALRNACFCPSPDTENWGILGRTICTFDFFYLSCPIPAPATARDQLLKTTARKLISINTSQTSSIQKQKAAAVKEEHTSTLTVTAMQTVGAAGGIFLLSCMIICPCFRVKKKEAERPVLAHAPHSMDSISSFEASSTSELATASPRRYMLSPRQSSSVGAIVFTMAQINKATRNFSPTLRIGQGGFGMVYKGQLDDGRIVAIKRAKKDKFDARLTAEFRNEVGMLARIEHLNLVKLIGYCEQENEHILVTEYVPNSTLREHLDGQRGTFLDLSTRLDIAIDVSHALTYLHLYAGQPIIHRDVKSSNILLTENFRAKVADFGFSRTGPSEANETHVSTQVKGTAGYLDPEYLKTYQLTQKSDVYSFGILLIEILTGRRPIELKKDIEERITVRWAYKKTNEGKAIEILDSRLVRLPGIDVVAEEMFELAFQCSAPTRSDRPTMNQAGEQLWAIRKNYQTLKSEAKPDCN